MPNLPGLVGFLLILTLTSARELNMNIADPTQGLEMAQFEVDLGSERGRALMKSFLEDPHQISLDNHFADESNLLP